jgi:hypothetical protein
MTHLDEAGPPASAGDLCPPAPAAADRPPPEPPAASERAGEPPPQPATSNAPMAIARGGARTVTLYPVGESTGRSLAQSPGAWALGYLLAGGALLIGAPRGIYWLVPGTLLCLVGGMVNAWVLLVEIVR